MTETREVPTRSGTARVTWVRSRSPRASLFLGHGAGGGIDAIDLVAVAAALSGADVSVALVEQPYRVAGKAIASDKSKLDDAFVDVVTAERPPALPLFVGGRSAGARVACRTAAKLGAAGVVALAFPLLPPKSTGPSRLPELEGAGVPALVVQGTRDPFGGPSSFPSVTRLFVVEGGDHSFKVLKKSGRDQRSVLDELAAGVRDFVLSSLGEPPARRASR